MASPNDSPEDNFDQHAAARMHQHFNSADNSDEDDSVENRTNEEEEVKQHRPGGGKNVGAKGPWRQEPRPPPPLLPVQTHARAVPLSSRTTAQAFPRREEESIPVLNMKIPQEQPRMHQNPYRLISPELTSDEMNEIPLSSQMLIRFIPVSLGNESVKLFTQFGKSLDFRNQGQNRPDEFLFKKLISRGPTRIVAGRFAEEPKEGDLQVYAIPDLTPGLLDARGHDVIAVLGWRGIKYIAYINLWPDKEFSIEVCMGFFALKDKQPMQTFLYSEFPTDFHESHIVLYSLHKNPLPYVHVAMEMSKMPPLDQPPPQKQKRVKQLHDQIQKPPPKRRSSKHAIQEDAPPPHESSSDEQRPVPIHVDDAYARESFLFPPTRSPSPSSPILRRDHNHMSQSDSPDPSVIRGDGKRSLRIEDGKLMIPQRMGLLAQQREQGVFLSTFPFGDICLTIVPNIYDLTLLQTPDDFKAAWDQTMKNVTRERSDVLFGHGLGTLLYLAPIYNFTPNQGADGYGARPMMRVFNCIYMSITPWQSGGGFCGIITLCVKKLIIESAEIVPLSTLSIQYRKTTRIKRKWMVGEFVVPQITFNSIGTIQLCKMLLSILRRDLPNIERSPPQDIQLDKNSYIQ
jgi:hypothetical protein